MQTKKNKLLCFSIRKIKTNASVQTLPVKALEDAEYDYDKT
jgi:hypothetical protein